MKLLIVTQDVDTEDPVLGFFVRWIEEFAKHYEQIEVICLKEGKYALPANVRVHSLGKENGPPRFARRLVYAFRFYALLWRLHGTYDAVFVHMNPEYIVLVGPFWRLSGTRVALWYTHKDVNLKLRLAVFFANVVLTASKESFRLKSAKVRVMGHGIDTERAVPSPLPHGDSIHLMTSGRISRVKHLEVLIQAFLQLKKQLSNTTFSIFGGPAVYADHAYEQELRDMLQTAVEDPNTIFAGVVPHERMPQMRASMDYFLHASETGSLDKAVLDAIMSGVIPISSSEAYRELFAENGSLLKYPTGDSTALAECIIALEALPPNKRDEIRTVLRARVEEKHSLRALIPRICAELEGNKLNPRDFYNRVMPDKLGDDYERARWTKTPLVAAQYAMTAETIMDYVVPTLQHAKRILEVGPGPSTWTKLLLHANPNAHYTLVDISNEMLAQARAALSDKANVTFVESDLMTFEGPEQFDGFFSSRAIEYMPDKEMATKKIASHLASGATGVIITKTPKYFFDRLRGRQVSNLHQAQIAPEALSRALTNAGLRVQHVLLVTATVPGFGSVVLNKIAFRLLHRLSLVFPLTLFTESYCIVFKKS